ncbi:MAG: SWIM zinc finger family protein [Elusimicrobia bacterium]|nr:SWIM zinc finger family protein [Elusimicrobiota bacterium]
MAAGKMKNNPAKNPHFYVDPEKMKDCVRDGTVLRAKVLGTRAYKVKTVIKGNRLLKSRCTCPAYRNYANCKHITAVYIAYREHPGWFQNLKGTEKKVDKIPPEQAITILKLLMSAMPDAKRIVENELKSPESKTEAYCRDIMECFKSSLDGPDDATLESLDIYHNKAEILLKSGECFACIKLCFEIVYGCIHTDASLGSTEIFPEGFAEGVWQTYMKALKKGKFKALELEIIKKQLDQLNSFEGFYHDQEGFWPQEGIDYLKEKKL